MRIAFYCPAVPGHLHPMITLARAVQSLGHDVFFLGIPDAEPMARAYGLEFAPMGAQMFPLGETARRAQKLGQLSGNEALEYSMEWFADGSRAVLDDGPRAIAESKPDALVLDATQTGLNLIALKQGMPFVHVCNALHFDFSGKAPLCVFPWPYDPSPEGIARNVEGLKGFGAMMAKVSAIRRNYIVSNGIGVDPDHPDASLSKLAVITQCPREFDFPSDHFPAHFHHAGPFHDKSVRPSMEFPWDRLTGEPMIYASLGTLQNGSERVFQAIVAAAEAPDRQLVLSIGPNLTPESIDPVAANTIIVQRAPQLALLERATLCITHAGLNTVLESLTNGLPMVAIPIANDQHGVAARITYTHTGEVVPLTELSPERLREALDQVLSDDSYRARAREIQSAIQQTDGLHKAARIIDDVLRKALGQ